jgi:aspartate semialdehyde dehydrogenase (EC 1.2.1.11)
VGKDIAPLKDAYSIEELKTLDVILTCQGGDYTNEVFPKLREAGWQGYWIDAASSLRMQDDAVIVSTRSTARSSTSSSMPVPRTTSAATAPSA